MHLADIIVALIGIGMLVVLLSCGVAAFGVMREIAAYYRDVLARARANPRFGMGAIFRVVTIAAVASALFQSAADADHPALTAMVALAAIVLATGIVCGIQFVFAEFRESWSRRQASFRQNEMVWSEPAPSGEDETEGRRRRESI